MLNRDEPDRRLRGYRYRLRKHLVGPIVSGPISRAHINPTAGLANVLINTSGGDVEIGEYVFFGHDVMLLTGTHDFRTAGINRQTVYETTARSIVIEAGAWIASRAIIVGPCRIGTNAVIGCGCVIDFDVDPNTIVRLRQEISTDTIRGLNVSS
jgi:acetyltransferase-like isoleucine patch superfamily enzyme